MPSSASAASACTLVIGRPHFRVIRAANRGAALLAYRPLLKQQRHGTLASTWLVPVAARNGHRCALPLVGHELAQHLVWCFQTPRFAANAYSSQELDVGYRVEPSSTIVSSIRDAPFPLKHSQVVGRDVQ